MLKIKEIRERKNITQDKMVELTGINKRSYVDYENGKTDVPLSKLQNIATSLNVSILQLTGKVDINIKQPAEVSEPTLLDPCADRIARAEAQYERIIEQKERVIELLTEQKNHYQATNEVLQNRIEKLYEIMEDLKNEADLSADLQKIQKILFSPF